MSLVILKRAVLPLLFVVPRWLQLIPFNIVANMQMAVSIYHGGGGYPLLIQHQLGAGPCQSNSHTDVLPLGTGQLIKAAFVWGRICGSQESQTWLFHFLSPAPQRIAGLFAYTLEKAPS